LVMLMGLPYQYPSAGGSNVKYKADDDNCDSDNLNRLIY
jgi:hypothetical protein